MLNKKLLASFAALFAAAFVVMSTAAQAAVPPHWYSNGALVGSAPVPTVSWGTLATVGNKGSGEGSIECHNVIGGFVKNPEGGGAGEGVTQEFAAYECSGNLPCSPGHERAVAVPASLQPGWPSKLEEKEGIRVNSTGVEVEVGCVQPPLWTEVKGSTLVTSATALQNPLGPSGTRKGTSATSPGITVFDEKTGELELKEAKA